MFKTYSMALLAMSLSASALAVEQTKPVTQATTAASFGNLLASKDVSKLSARLQSQLNKVAMAVKKGQPGSCVVLHGPTGTDKTPAASLLANKLGRAVYQVDMAAVVSKYIGETEKNLDHVFRLAQTNDWLLFFDEADALFAQRSEVKDAHDRYANIETGLFLRKLEAYQGIVILTTNSPKQLRPDLQKHCKHNVKLP